MKHLASCILCLFIVTGTALAQPLSRDYSVRIWTTDNGLPVNRIRDIVQTLDGFLWLATDEGLVRFDGLSFQTFDLSNTPAFADKDVHSLYLFPDSSMIAGFYKGDLISYKKLQFSRLFDRELNWIKCILSLAEDPGKGLWFGTDGFGLGHLAYDGKMSWVTDKNGLPDNYVQALLPGRDSVIWIGTRYGLCLLDKGKLSVYSTRDGLPHNDIRSLCYDATGKLWIGTNGGGISVFSEGRFSRPESWKSTLPPVILRLYRDRSGGMWAGTNSGLFLFKDGQARGINASEGLSGNVVNCIWQDHENTIWAGTEGAGLNALRPRIVRMLTEADGLSDHSIGPVLKGVGSTLFLGTGKGAVNMISSAVIEKIEKIAGLPSIPVNSLAYDSSGTLWIGTDGNGIFAHRPGKTVHLTTADGIASDMIHSVYADRSGYIWAGVGNAGINRLGKGKIDWIYTKNGLSHDQVNCFLEDRRGRMLVGTNGGGINVIREGSITWLTTQTGLPDNVVSCFYEDADGLIWVGFAHGGLAVLENDSAGIIGLQDGLYADAIYQILEDSRGNFWFTSNKGIFSVSRNELMGILENRIDLVHPAVYGKAEGMLTAECSDRVFPAGCIDRNDILYIPTRRGLAVLDAANVSPMEDMLELRLMRVLVNSEEVDPFKALVLNPGTFDLEFDFSSPTFLNPEKIQYKYMLEGYDHYWINAGNRRQAYYTHIPPGRYVFKVTALGNNGVWTDEKRLFSVRIKPYFYKTSWFILPLALLAGLLLWMFISMRIRKSREKTLKILVEERTRDLQEEIEQRKKIQEESDAAKEKIEESDRLKSSVISFLNQYFRSPVNSIMGFSELMMQGKKEEKGNEMPRYIRDSGEQMLKMLDSVMLVAKLGPDENNQESVMDVLPLVENSLKKSAKQDPAGKILEANDQRPTTTDSCEAALTNDSCEAAYDSREAAKDARSAKFHILLVEDNSINVELVKAYIGQMYELDVAVNAEEAIAMAGKVIYDAILMDINLGPGMDGVEATGEIKKIAGYENVPIIAVTGFTMAGMKKKVMDGGASYFLAKPFGKSMLVDLLESALPEDEQSGPTTAA